ncbi:hypothetical protein VP01_5351g1, partial [Puccinia sorghi]
IPAIFLINLKAPLRELRHQSPNCPDNNGSHSQLTQDHQILPINSAPDPQLAPNETNTRNRFSFQSLPIKLEGATHQRETKDDNDLYKGNKNLRLCCLGVDELHSHGLNQLEEKFHPAVDPSDEVEDCSSSIEKQLKNCMAGTKEPQLAEDKERI